MNCAICREPLRAERKVQTLGAKGRKSLLAATVARGDKQLHTELESIGSPCNVHAACYKDYTRETTIVAAKRKVIAADECTGNVDSGDRTLYGKGKKTAFHLARKTDLFPILESFEKPETPKAEIENAGEEFLLKFYGSNKLVSTLDKLRHYKYKQAIRKSSLTSTIKLESLPPTSAAAAQHSLRAYHQVQTWRGKMVDATAWGWQIGDGILAPVETTKGVAPENLLKMVACGCKTQCGKSCGCRKLGFKCSSMCSHCEGESCSNRLEDL
ncbi:hypothetical protein CAPTEDRAFT_206230 [Capitella teleta]|uniref:Tesmin/TSO1-like CXC domain-containing protein n=1 Tax=Capitella teleta TaxID=283909 RepID=R7UP56_CAPTE|nr:hypothetical protein CAPTEDRAFT_206230 [Capitella teleta]|eukprot:ELU07980.1 hypothetical protein CAPTEDRAFT_206230 [Capitella teleta]